MTFARLSQHPSIDPSATVQACHLGRYTEIGARSSVIETEVGDYSYIVNDCDVIYSQIGNFCSIAAQVRINPGNHPMGRASQAHFSYRPSKYWPDEVDEAEFFAWRRSNPVRIGHDVWIGHGAIVLPGRTIGTGAVVAAGAVVTREVAPYAVVAGVPAVAIRQRFDPAIAEGLLRLQWWNWDHAALQAALPDFRALSVADFLEKYL